MLSFHKLSHIPIDADSLIFKALYNVEGSTKKEVLEEAYRRFVGMIKNIEYRARKELGIAGFLEAVIILSPDKSFRNAISQTYKGNRQPKDPYINELKKIVYSRYGKQVLVSPIVEADDIIVYISNTYRTLISAYDKDVLNVTKEKSWNYMKKKWEEPLKQNPEIWYIKQCLMGDTTDGIKGAKGFGKDKAQDYVDMWKGNYSWSHFVSQFKSEDEAILTMRLIRMDQWSIEKGLKLWTPADWKFNP